MLKQGARLKKIRQALNLSQEALAESLNLSRAGIAAVEADKNKFSQDVLYKLVENFDINLNFLVYGIGNMFNNTCENTHVLIKNEKALLNLKNWGKRLGQILSENEETPYAFSKRTGIKESRIEKFILNSDEPTLDEVNAIKCNVDVSIDELLYGETVEKNTQAGNNISLSTDEILKIKQLLNKSND